MNILSQKRAIAKCMIQKTTEWELEQRKKIKKTFQCTNLVCGCREWQSGLIEHLGCVCLCKESVRTLNPFLRGSVSGRVGGWRGASCGIRGWQTSMIYSFIPSFGNYAISHTAFLTDYPVSSTCKHGRGRITQWEVSGHICVCAQWKAHSFPLEEQASRCSRNASRKLNVFRFSAAFWQGRGFQAHISLTAPCLRIAVPLLASVPVFITESFPGTSLKSQE